MKRTLLSVIVVSLLLAVDANATTYYVATTGNDANTCGQAQSTSTPKLTLNNGVTCLSPGDILYILNGTYAEALLDITGVSRPQGSSYDIGAYEEVSGMKHRVSGGLTVKAGITLR